MKKKNVQWFNFAKKSSHIYVKDLMFPDVNDLLCCRLNMHSSFPVRTAADDDFEL